MPPNNQGRQPYNRGRKLPPEPLSADEVRTLLAACSGRAPTGIRNRSLIVLLYRGMLRCREALDLLPTDLDPDRGTVHVRRGKGDRRRIVGIDPQAVALVQRWIDCRRNLGIGPRRRLICTLAGGPVYPSYVRTLLSRLGRKAGIERRVHPHGLRHTGAFELAGEGVPVHVIQQQLGHSSLATTDRYIRHLHPAAVVEAMRQRRWRAGAE